MIVGQRRVLPSATQKKICAAHAAQWFNILDIGMTALSRAINNARHTGAGRYPDHELWL